MGDFIKSRGGGGQYLDDLLNVTGKEEANINMIGFRVQKQLYANG